MVGWSYLEENLKSMGVKNSKGSTKIIGEWCKIIEEAKTLKILV